jgi:hypothetical protein
MIRPRFASLLSQTSLCFFVSHLALAGQSDSQKQSDVSETSSVKASSADPSALRELYRNLVRREAGKNHLPPDIADAVMAVESNYDPSVIGTVGEIGLMQVRPSTAAMLGFKGETEELARPEVNIRYGVAYLSTAWRLANGDLCRALMKYRAGHGEESMTALSVSYCGRARAHLAAIGSPYAAGADPLPSFGLAGETMASAKGGSRHGPKLRTAATSRAFWAKEQARVKAISARIEAKWRRMASR